MHSHTSRPDWLTTVLNHVAKSRFAEASTAAQHFARLQAFHFMPTDTLDDYYAPTAQLERIKSDRARHDLLDDLITNAMRILGKHSVPELQNLCVSVIRFHQQEVASLNARIDHVLNPASPVPNRNTRQGLVPEHDIAKALDKARRNHEDAQCGLKAAERTGSKDNPKEAKKLAMAEADRCIGQALYAAAVRNNANPTAVQEVLTKLEQAHVKQAYANALSCSRVVSYSKLERDARLDYQARLMAVLVNLLPYPDEQSLAA